MSIHALVLSYQTKELIKIGNMIQQTLINGFTISFPSVPQIIQFLLGDAIISSKTYPHNGSKKEKRSYGKVKHKQQSSIL